MLYRVTNGRSEQQDQSSVWFDIPVKDLGRASDFYAAVLAISVPRMEHEGVSFCVFDHEDGNGACLVDKPNEVSSEAGILVYLNVDGRIRDAVSQVAEKGGTVLEDVHPIEPWGYRAIIHDSEGNRLALHSNSDA